MKTFLLRLILGGLVLDAAAAPAELIIYSGTSKVTAIGQARTEQDSVRLFVVVDIETARVGELRYLNFNGQKAYSSHTLTNLHFVEAIGANGKTNTAISQLRLDCAISNNVPTESIFAQGAAAALTINTNTTVSFPKVLTSSRQDYYVDAASISIESRTLSFDKGNTLASNTAGEDLEEAVARLISVLQKLGYTPAP